jgi:N-methylhydantoinase A
VADGFVATPIYDRYALPAGALVAGPAILEEFDSTVVIQPGYEASVDPFGSVHLVSVKTLVTGRTAPTNPPGR